MNRQALVGIFVAESEELLADLEQALVALESGSGDGDVIHRVFRAAHTLKGNAGMTGVEPVVKVAHVMEGVLQAVRDGSSQVSREMVSELLGGVDLLRELVNEVAGSGQAALAEAHLACIARLEAFLPQQYSVGEHPSAAQTPTPSGTQVYDLSLKFRPDIFATGQDPALLVAELAELGELVQLEVDLKGLPRLANLDPEQCYLSWHAVLRTEAPRSAVEGVFLFVQGENPIVIRDVTARYQGLEASLAEKKIGELLVEAGCVKERDIEDVLKQQRRLGDLLVEAGKVEPQKVKQALERQQAARRVRQSSSIRVDTEKLDRLVNLVGELIICMAQVDKLVRDRHAVHETRVSALEALEQNSRDLQEQVMSLRMVPVRETFDRFKRAVRDLANDLGKYVVLDTSGTDTELDKNVIEQLVDPLKHMIRNCVSHGVESPAERIAAGKSDTGRIELGAAQREGHIIISVSDDGRGIDSEAVLERGRQLGLVPPGASLSLKEIYNLIFQPGFSTAKEVSEVSGRGVGLDVVRRNVEALRGTVEVDSEFGKGSTFRIRLPLTLAIIEGMNVRVGPETVTIPLLSVVELIEPTAEVIQTVEGKGEIVDVRGEILPMVRLTDLFKLSGGGTDAKDAKVVVVENDGRKFGVLVDRVVGMEQAVIRPLDLAFELFGRLDSSFRRAEGVAGATILGDGSVGLIFDVNGIERMAFGETH